MFLFYSALVVLVFYIAYSITRNAEDEGFNISWRWINYFMDYWKYIKLDLICHKHGIKTIWLEKIPALLKTGISITQLKKLL